ncbi:hypothetical protein ACINWC743_2746 [Acinetobacter sp. WC-743]|nr:hypothetical protein ACINWC743_2746 [Acinetobacter sp. WC-743]
MSAKYIAHQQVQHPKICLRQKLKKYAQINRIGMSQFSLSNQGARSC